VPAAWACYDRHGPMTSPETVHVLFQHAFNRHNLEEIVAMYERDAVFITALGPARGHDAIRDAYRALFESRPIIDLQTLDVTRVADVAMLQGKWTVRRMGHDGNEMSSQGRSMEVVRLQQDGRWLFVIDNPSVM